MAGDDVLEQKAALAVAVVVADALQRPIRARIAELAAADKKSVVVVSAPPVSQVSASPLSTFSKKRLSARRR